jgi:hypothetical protein
LYERDVASTTYVTTGSRRVTGHHLICCHKLRVSAPVLNHIPSSSVPADIDMARATTRSQRAPAASQAQPRQSQSQRTRRRGNDDSEDEGDGDRGVEDGNGDGDEDIHVADEGDTVSPRYLNFGNDLTISQEIKRKANDLVRLALFTEQKRTALRREDISKKGE